MHSQVFTFHLTTRPPTTTQRTDGMLDRRSKRMNIPGMRAGIWFALALGAVIGVALAILFIPRGGSAAAGDRRWTRAMGNHSGGADRGLSRGAVPLAR
jgi:hypothetical protein